MWQRLPIESNFLYLEDSAPMLVFAPTDDAILAFQRSANYTDQEMDNYWMTRDNALDFLKFVLLLACSFYFQFNDISCVIL